VSADEDIACAGEPHPRASHPPLEPSVLERAAGMFRAAGDPGRLRILHCLLCGEHCVTDLALESGDAMSTISQRLKILRAEGLVRRRRDGKHVYYALYDEHVAELVRGALAHAQHHEAEPKPG